MSKGLCKLVFSSFTIMTGFLAVAQDDGDGFNCCDPDASTVGGTFSVALCGGPQYPADGINCDPDCGDVDSNCTTIPLDGGLSLLALAGGGLATAAMRRRRREEVQRAEQTLN